MFPPCAVGFLCKGRGRQARWDGRKVLLNLNRVKEEKILLLACRGMIHGCVFVFTDPNGASPQTPVTFFLDKKSNQKNQESPEGNQLR